MLIQKFWRWYGAATCSKQLVARFNTLQLSPAEVGALGFGTIIPHVRKMATNLHFKLLIQRILKVSTSLYPPAGTAVHVPMSIRIFTAAYLIVYYPTHVFESMGETEEAAKRTATALLECLNAITEQFAIHLSWPAVPRELLQSFPALLNAYEQAFSAWKTPDMAKLTNRIKHALVALFTAELFIQRSTEDNTARSLEVRTHTQRLRQKLAQIGGQAALTEFDERLLAYVDWEMVANDHTTYA